MVRHMVDYTDEWVSLFRENVGKRRIPDAIFLKVALVLGKPDSEKYRKPDKRSVTKLLDSMEANQKENSVSPGEAVGMAAAHSMAESYTQKTLRTFHYAGLVGSLNPGEDIKKLVDLSSTMATRYTVALQPEYRMNFNEAQRLASKIQRWNIGEMFDMDIDLGIEDRLTDLQQRIRDFDDDAKYDGDSDELTEEFQALIDERNDFYQQATDLLVSNAENAYTNLVTIRPKEDALVTISMDEMKLQLENMLINASGERKAALAGDWDFSSISITNQGDKIIVAIPRNVLARRSVNGMLLSYMNCMEGAEFCRGCNNVLSVLSVGRVKDRTERFVVNEEIDDTAKEHYEKVLTVLEREAIQDDVDFDSEDFLDQRVRKNPPLEGEELEQAQTEASAMVKVSGSPDDLFFSLKERYPNWRNCQECGGGWWNVSAGVAQVKDYNIESLEQALQADASESGQRASKIFSQVKDNDDFLRYPFAWKDHQFEPPTPEISYAFNTVTTDLLPCNPLPGEYYLEVAVVDEKNVWKGSKFCAGHFAHITGQYHDKGFSEPSFIEADPTRSVTTNVIQIERTLGIEAARQMLYQSMTQLYTGGQWLKGFDMRISDRHMLLVADNYTSTGRLLGAPGSTASISGLNAAKGLSGYESAVLAKTTYERPTDVILKKRGAAAPMGMVDPLIEPMSAQIVGAEMKMGTGMHFDEGRYATEDLYNARYASQWFEAAYMSLLELFRPLGLSLQAAENVMNLPPDHELYPKRVYESDDYKEALKELKEAKAEYDKYHGKVIDVLQLDEMLMKANKRAVHPK